MESMSATDIAVYENLMLAPWMIAVIVIGMPGPGGVHCVHLQCGAPPAGAVRQAGGGPEDVRRTVHSHSH